MKINLMVAIAAAALALAACSKKDDAAKTTTAAAEPPKTTTPSAPATGIAVSGFTVGNAIGSDKKIRAGSTTLGTRDTLYVSIDTSGTGDATLKSRWTFVHDGRSTLVNEDTQKVSSNGAATHEFHVSKPDGWPKGNYQVEIFVNDASAGTRQFSVA